MSEHLSHSPERAEAPDPVDSAEQQAERLKTLEKHAEQAEQHESHHVEQARHQAHSEALSSSETAAKAATEHSNHRPSNQAFANKELKDMAYKRTMTRVRKQLPALDRLASRVIHQPLVDQVSESAANSIARPSGILGGGLFAFIGTTAYYYITKHYGYSYSFFVFLLLLAVGFLFGWAVELIWNSVRLRNQ